ncbi:CU044_5270 family protein [Actinocorallia lasiicapitis]
MVFDLLKSLGSHLDRDHRPDLSDARAKALAGFTSTEKRHRMRFSSTARLALAAAGTAAFIIVPVTLVAQRDDDARVPAPGSLDAPTAAPSPPAALAQPRPDQLVYVSIKADWGGGKPVTALSWYSQDVKRRPHLFQRQNQEEVGEAIPGRPGWAQFWSCPGAMAREDSIVKSLDDPPNCLKIAAKNKKMALGGNGEPLEIQYDAVPPTYLGGLPTEVPGMRSWIKQHTNGGNPPAVQEFTTVGDVLRQAYAPPAVAKAFFETTKAMPGVVLKENVKDFIGRPGIELSQTWHGEHHGYIFDPVTFQFIGETGGMDLEAPAFNPDGGETPDETPWTPSPKEVENAAKYPVKASSAVVEVGIVDRYGQTLG